MIFFGMNVGAVEIDLGSSRDFKKADLSINELGSCPFQGSVNQSGIDLSSGFNGGKKWIKFEKKNQLVQEKQIDSCPYWNF